MTSMLIGTQGVVHHMEDPIVIDIKWRMNMTAENMELRETLLTVDRPNYPTYEQREEVKKRGWDFYHNCTDVHQKSWCLLETIIWAHYWRAREALETARNTKTLLRKIRGKNYYQYYELDIDHYTNHWLHANRNLCSDEVLHEIEEQTKYTPEENKYLPIGHTNYVFHQETT